MKRLSTPVFMGLGALLLSAGPARADAPVWVGDPVNGAKLYAAECAACHGDDGRGGRTGVALTRADRLNLIRDDQMFQMIETGAGLKKPKDHTLKDKLKFLEIWDVVAFTRTLHMTIADFFPSASRYVSKEYTIDKYGLQRIEENGGMVLKGKDQTAAVFTLFDFEGEEGNLKYVPQDPILLDQLKKPNKAGYLVFLPFKTDGFEGELGVAMDATGVITKLGVHGTASGAELLNKSLSRFEGMGKKGQKTPFKVSGGKDMDKLAKDVFPAYLRAMETVTMYDREERERTWADDE
ncbi:MAG: c-type cytochrome [Deltaproteobacteria bacterium]|nr:c-type cytochrome [Deltaproteobacteria bacterium]